MQYLEHRLSSFFEKSGKSSCKSNLFLIKCHHIYGLAKETMAERKFLKMRKDIHPEYRTVVFMDTTTGYKFLSGSTKNSKETVEFEGETYPLIRVEICIRFTSILYWTPEVYPSRWPCRQIQQKIRYQIRNNTRLNLNRSQDLRVVFFCFFFKNGYFFAILNVV